MRKEKDFLGEMELADDALYGIHSLRAAHNFPGSERFSIEWYRAAGMVKRACYETIQLFKAALGKEHPDILSDLRIPSDSVIAAMIEASIEIASGKHFDHFIVPALQGGAGTSINMNINEIIANRSLQLLNNTPGSYQLVDPIESANLYQSTNDVIPTALKIAVIQLLKELETSVNGLRQESETLEKKYRNTLRLAYTQLQEAVPSTYGSLFSTYSDALSRDWWRISKSFERIKQINLGGGAIGTGIGTPRFFIMEVGNRLRKLTGLPLAQGENLQDVTANQDSLVEVHGIMKAHAVNMEKIASDLRILSSGLSQDTELTIPEKQTGSSIMPGKVNPVIAEYIISGAHRIYSNDQLITNLAGQGNLDLNAFLPEIGNALINSLKILIKMDQTMKVNLLSGLEINSERAARRLFRSPAVTTAISPLIGYNKAAELAKYMKAEKTDIYEANKVLKTLDEEQLKKLMKPETLLKRGFTASDIREFKEGTI